MSKYMGRGHVNFPLNDPEWQDSKLGLATIRILVIDSLGSESIKKPGVVGTDDVFVAADIDSDGKKAFDFVRENRLKISDSYLIGCINWLGVHKNNFSDFWRCQYEDLTREGKTLYDSLKYRNIGFQIVIITSMNHEESSIKNIKEDAEALCLPVLEF